MLGFKDEIHSLQTVKNLLVSHCSKSVVTEVPIILKPVH